MYLAWIVDHGCGIAYVRQLHRLVDEQLWKEVVNEKWIKYGESPGSPPQYTLERIVCRPRRGILKINIATFLVDSGANIDVLAVQDKVSAAVMVCAQLPHTSFVRMMEHGHPCMWHIVMYHLIENFSMRTPVDYTTSGMLKINSCLPMLGDVDRMHYYNRQDIPEPFYKFMPRCDWSSRYSGTLLRHALARDCIAVIEALLDAGASPNDESCAKLYQKTIRNGNLGGFDYDEGYSEILRAPVLLLLLQHGLEVDTGRNLLKNIRASAWEDPLQSEKGSEACWEFMHTHACMPLQHLAAVVVRKEWRYATLQRSGILSMCLLDVVRRATGQND